MKTVALLGFLFLVGCSDNVGSQPDSGMPVSDGGRETDAGDRDLGTVNTGATISAGGAHTCAVESGSVLCWGLNSSGQLGINATAFPDSHHRSTPTEVPSLSDVVEVAAGSKHTCARRASGQVLCWGSNDVGQLGDGSRRAEGLVPTMVPGLANAVELSAGASHTCARRTSGEVVCWGSNQFGQLGDGSLTERRSPTAVLGLGTVVQIATGSSHTCAVRASGSVVCWGYNAQRAVDPSLAETTILSPTEVAGVSSVVSLSAGGHTCAVQSSGNVICWGTNMSGQLGDGTGVNPLTPVAVTGLADALTVSASAYHTCAVRRGGSAICWGRNGVSQLGDNTTMDRLAPVNVMRLTGVTAVVTGDEHSCAATSTGVVCWGSDASGQLGDG